MYKYTGITSVQENSRHLYIAADVLLIADSQREAIHPQAGV